MTGGGIKLSDAQILDWLRLIRTEGVGPRTFQSLINHFGSASEAVLGLPDLARRKAQRLGDIPSVETAERELSVCRKMGARFIARGESAYPKALAAIDSAPPLIAVAGPLDLADVPMIAIVGSRNASAAGLRFTGTLAEAFGRENYVVVSGLARGIDTRAHETSLATGTVAVLAGGLDRLYPEENRRLFERLCAEGAVISEMPFGWEPRGRDFPRRNRIVSGLCLGTVVVEAARKSGSLITARFALEQGREVFAVPGSPLDLRAEGPNDLIRQGAKLVRNAEDVLEDIRAMRGWSFEQGRMDDAGDAEAVEPLWEELDLFSGPAAIPLVQAVPPFDGWEEPAMDAPYPAEEAPQSLQTGTLAPVHRDVLGLIGLAPVHPDELARAAGMSIRKLQLILFDLEQAGQIERDAMQNVILAVRATASSQDAGGSGH